MGRARSATKVPAAKSAGRVPRKASERPKQAGGRSRKRWLEDYAAVGPPPADPLAVAGYAMALLSVALNKIRQDPGIDERTRLRELRSTAKTIRDLMPLERLRQAERLIRDDMERRGLRTEAAEAAEVVSVPPSGDPAPLATTNRRVRRRQR